MWNSRKCAGSCVALMLIGAGLVSCASTPAGDVSTPVTVTATEAGAPGSLAPVQFERGPIGPLVRELGKRTGRNIVLMNGIEFYSAGPYTLDQAPADEIVKRIAADSGMVLSRQRGIDFIHPAGYEPLTEFTPSAALDRAIARTPVTIRLGAETPIFGAFALLGHSYKLTLIADNVIASARCGEVHLRDVPLADALDAILRSARLTDATCTVQSAGDTVFVASTSARQRSRVLVNSPSAPRPRDLNRQVSLYLPTRHIDPRRLPETPGATPLTDCLASMSEQLGMKVEADRRSSILPVNPAVMIDVPIETAMRLLIQQWPLPHYGYTATGDTIRIVYLGPPAD